MARQWGRTRWRAGRWEEQDGGYGNKTNHHGEMNRQGSADTARQGRAEHGRAEQSRQSRARHGRAEQSRAGQGRVEQGRLGQARPGQNSGGAEQWRGRR